MEEKATGLLHSSCAARCSTGPILAKGATCLANHESGQRQNEDWTTHAGICLRWYMKVCVGQLCISEMEELF